ncbi:YihY/virulence factor BrkB family protein [Vagococcus carniphilus]|uniref:YihY/virulence factor BrkB family protein n=1 Tax=Vagococcus carniphilus TaxID=218144 RepID=A0AAW8U6K8_9ENTE|nr:YihY/virulence factor BrkB family protein [Vagococcus carniphilus]MDT2813676.1 YihY/virulence factor BrkB family protein [Vagococcus carniphilus]MDT2833571.1 YihY/virulence factor BrkB family protein [Vagococcus carniphilus]MDT2865773.1 YihY/virulence factor BrkB family protein [Vagococcus carniphilus]
MEQQEKKRPGWKESFKIFFETFQQAEVNIYAIVITYYLLLSFFPLLIALGNILPFLNLSKESVLPYIKELLPPYIYGTMKDIIGNLLEKSNGGLLSISAIGTFWAMSKGINAIRISLDKAYGVSRESLQFIRRIFSFLMVFILIFAIFLLLLIMGFGQTILEYILPIFGQPEEILTTFKALKWPVTSSVLLVTIFMLFYFVPSAKVHFKTIIPGTIFTTLGWMAVTQFYGIYIAHFSKRINSYGLIGSVIFFILWLNIAATLIIIGGVINVTFEKIIYGEIKQKRSVLREYIEKKLPKKLKEEDQT